MTFGEFMTQLAAGYVFEGRALREVSADWTKEERSVACAFLDHATGVVSCGYFWRKRRVDDTWIDMLEGMQDIRDGLVCPSVGVEQYKLKYGNPDGTLEEARALLRKRLKETGDWQDPPAPSAEMLKAKEIYDTSGAVLICCDSLFRSRGWSRAKTCGYSQTEDYFTCTTEDGGEFLIPGDVGRRCVTDSTAILEAFAE